MKILIIAGFADSIVPFRGDLIRAMQACGCVVHVAAPTTDSVAATASALARLKVVTHDIAMDRTGTNPLSDLRLGWQLCLLMRKLQPGVVLGYTIKPVIYGMISAWLAGVPRRYALITGLGYAFTGARQNLLTRLVSALYRFAMSKTHKVFFQNPDDERLFRELRLVPASVPSVVVNGSGVDVAEYAVKPLPSDTPIFLMIGRLLGDKGIREYAQAASMVKALRPDARFLMAGWIDTNPDAVTQYELDSWIADGALEFLGKLDDVRPAIGAATVYVLPSYREGAPRTVLEAMSMGRPIITTDAPGCRETVIDGENGFLVPVKSVDALVEAMLRFIEDPTLAPRMGKRSREIAEEKYDVHKVNAVMLREMRIVPPQDDNAHAA